MDFDDDFEFEADPDDERDRMIEDETDWDAVTALGGFATASQIAAYRKDHPQA